MIDVINASKSFDGKPILKNISVKFLEGKTNLIIGRSGSGKTVLLKSIVGLHNVDEGKILFDGRDFSLHGSQKDRILIRREIGMLFQGSALFDWMKVEENVRFPLDMFTSMTNAEKRKRVEFCLERVKLQHAHKLMPGEISGGMQKRVAIARAIALNPKYLFCDEPNSGLDPKTSLVIDQLIHDITEEYNMTTIINTHDMNSVMEIGDRILFINEGRNAWEGTKEEVFKSDNEDLNNFVFASNLYRRIKDTF